MLTIAILWQSQLATDHSNLLIIFIALVALAVVGQLVVLVGMAVGARKTQQEVLAIAQRLEAKAVPVLDSVSDIVRDSAPKIRVITSNLVETTETIREKAREMDLVVSEASSKARQQVARVDGIVTSTLDTAGRVAAEVHQAVMIPVRHISGILNGLRVGLETLRSKASGLSQKLGLDDLRDE